MGCNNSTESGCRCGDHDPGLGVHAVDPIAYEQALRKWRAAEVRLSVVTLGPSTEPEPCTNSMLCRCKSCEAATAFLSARGGQGEGNASPFKTRKAA